MENKDAGGVSIRSVVADDADAIVAIYNHYVAQTIITFEEEPVSASDMRQRITDVQSAPLPWLVAERNETVV